MDTYKLAIEKCDELSEEMSGIANQAAILDLKKARLTREFHAWTIIRDINAPTRVATFGSDEGQMVQVVVPLHPPQDDTSKTERVIGALRKAGSEGLRPREITSQLASEGIDLGPGFSNNAVFRLVKKGLAVQIEKRYILKEFVQGSLEIPEESQKPAEAGL